MAGQRLSMRKTREILRQKWCLGRSHREVARSLGKSVGAISATLRGRPRRGSTGRRSWPLSDEALDARLYGAPAGGDRSRFLPDFAAVHAERKRPGVTLELLHLEYLEQHPDGYRYTQFCEYYRRWLKRRRLSMRQIHRAGEKLFVDYAGQSPQIVDPATGEVTRGRALRRRARRVELHLRRSDADPARAGLDREPRAGLRVLWWGRSRRRARSAQERRHDGVPLRARRAAHLRGAGAALRHGDPAGAPRQAARQGQGGGRRPGGRALDPRAAAQRDLLLAGGAQRAHPRAARWISTPARCAPTGPADRSSSSGSTGRR